MADMRSGHEKVMAADGRRGTRRRPTMDLDMLAKNIVIANLEVGLFAFIAFVLRRVTQHRPRMDLVVCSYLGRTGQAGVGHDACSPFDLDRAVDHDVGTDLNLGFDLSLGVDNSGRMDGHENRFSRRTVRLVGKMNPKFSKNSKQTLCDVCVLCGYISPLRPRHPHRPGWVQLFFLGCDTALRPMR